MGNNILKPHMLIFRPEPERSPRQGTIVSAPFLIIIIFFSPGNRIFEALNLRKSIQKGGAFHSGRPKIYEFGRIAHVKCTVARQRHLQVDPYLQMTMQILA